MYQLDFDANVVIKMLRTCESHVIVLILKLYFYAIVVIKMRRTPHVIMLNIFTI